MGYSVRCYGFGGACGLERDNTAATWGTDCPACGNRHTLYTSHKIWRHVTTLLMLRRGIPLPDYRTAPFSGTSSRGYAVACYAMSLRSV